LSDDDLRVQYSGYVIFAAQIISVATGLIFTLLLTRNMTEDQFGVWSNIFDLTAYFTVAVGLFPFWATRFVARKKEGAVKTGLAINLVLALVAMALYVPVVFPATMAFHSEAFLAIYLIAAFQILNLYLINMLESCLRSTKPRTIGFGLLIEEVIKVSLALLFIVGFHQLFIGAIVSLVVGGALQIAFYIRLVAKDLRERIQWNYVAQWLKGSTVLIYNAVGNSLLSSVFILLLVLTPFGKQARGDYAAAVTFANVIGYASYLSYALYPKLISKGCSEDEVSLNFRTVLMFAIPLATVALAMPQSLLTILNVSYTESAPILQLLTVDAIVVIVSQFYGQCLMGAENLDQEGKISLRKLVRSKIFKVFSLPYIQAAIAVPSVYFALTQLAVSSSEQAALIVVAINILAHSVTFVGLCMLMHKSVRFSVAWRSIGKYVFAASVSAIVLLLLPNPTTLLLTLGKGALGIAVYGAILVAIDGEARKLIGQTLREIKNAVSRKESPVANREQA